MKNYRIISNGVEFRIEVEVEDRYGCFLHKKQLVWKPSDSDGEVFYDCDESGDLCYHTYQFEQEAKIKLKEFQEKEQKRKEREEKLHEWRPI